ncbi:MAG TPA: DUF3892 domain-containing protein [Solirubrobacterales bacterium]
MAQQVRIECINKTPRQDPHLRIENVGGVNSDGNRWTISENEAIVAIENGTYSFYVNVNGRVVNVIVATHEGRKYLKTEADGLQPNNLLSLPECP